MHEKFFLFLIFLWKNDAWKILLSFDCLKSMMHDFLRKIFVFSFILKKFSKNNFFFKIFYTNSYDQNNEMIRWAWSINEPMEFIHMHKCDHNRAIRTRICNCIYEQNDNNKLNYKPRCMAGANQMTINQFIAYSKSWQWQQAGISIYIYIGSGPCQQVHRQYEGACNFFNHLIRFKWE